MAQRGKNWIAWLAGALAVSGLLATAVACARNQGTREPTAMAKHEIALDGTILSTPALGQGESHGEAWVAFVLGNVKNSVGPLGRTTARQFGVDAYQFSGGHIRSFPILSSDGQKSPYRVAPGQQVVPVGLHGKAASGMAVVDLEGRFCTYDLAGKEAGCGSPDPRRGLLVWAPTPVRNQQGQQIGWVLVSADYGPYFESKNQVDVVDLQGASLPGFPVSLGGFPQQHAPVVDTLRQRLYVLIRSTGEVDGFDLAKGGRLAGFPATLPAPEPDTVVRSMVFYRAWDGLAVASGGNSLLKVDGASGKVSEVAVNGAMRLATLASLGDTLAVVDDGRKQVALLDQSGRVFTAFTPKEWGPSRESYLLEWLPGTADGPSTLLAFSWRNADPLVEMEKLYDKYKTAESEREIEAYYRKWAKSNFGTEDWSQMTAQQRDELRRAMVDSKQGYVEEWIGMERRMQEMDMSTETGIDVIRVSAQGMQAVYSDVIKGYWPESGVQLTPRAMPAVLVDAGAKRIRVALPVNAHDPAADDAESARKARMSLYNVAME